MLPKVRNQPPSSHRPKRTFAIISRLGMPPYIGIMVYYPAIIPVHPLSGFRAVFFQLVDGLEKWLLAFGQISYFRRPIIHLEVNVHGIRTIPGRDNMIIPYPL